MRIKDFPLDERPRERLVQLGPSALSNAELLAILLNNGSKALNAVELARKVFSKFTVFSELTKSVNQLKKIPGIGTAKACKIVAVFELAKRFNSLRYCVTQPTLKDIIKQLVVELGERKKEYFVGVYLDSKNRVLKREILFIGTLNATAIHPREIYKAALLESARKLLLVHNHPSGDPTPSKEDILVTNQLVKAGEILGIELVDHVIVASGHYRRILKKLNL